MGRSGLIACSHCGKRYTPRDGDLGRCRSCRTIGRNCLRCGKPVPRAALTLPGGVACPSCARYYKEPRPCSICGTLSIRLTRDFRLGIVEPACPKCRRKDHETCAGCGKHRLVAGRNDHGRPLCQACLSGEPFLCPSCGKYGRRHSAKQCETCYWSSHLYKKAQADCETLKSAWGREWYMLHLKRLEYDVGPKTANLRAGRHLLFFIELERLSSNGLTADELAKAFGAEGLRRYAAPYGSLVKAGLLPEVSKEILEEIGQKRLQSQILEKAQNDHDRLILATYLDDLRAVAKRFRQRGWTGNRIRMTPRTLTSALRAAAHFLDHADIKPYQIYQHHLDRYLVAFPGRANPLRRFVRFLVRRRLTFARVLVIPVLRTTMITHHALPEQRRIELLGQLLATDDRSTGPALACLLMLLCAQKEKDLVRLQRSALAVDQNGCCHILLAKVPIPLPPPVALLATRHLELTEKNDPGGVYLFPGRRLGSHMHPATITYHLGHHHVTADQLFATALTSLIMHGLRFTKSLSDGFGISIKTAIDYVYSLDPAMRAEVEALAKGGRTFPAAGPRRRRRSPTT